MGLIRQLLRTTLTWTLPTERWLVHGPRSARPRPQLAFTFDDGPDPVQTPAVLDTLARWRMVGTFFVIGEKAVAYPELIRRIVDEGHALGNHTWTHGEPRRTSTAEFLREVRETDDRLEALTGVRPYWMRPPKGELTARKLAGLWRLNHGVALWNIDPRDYRMTSSSEARAWVRRYQPAAGDVVLLHDRHPWAIDILNECGEQGLLDAFATCRLDDWLPAGVVGTRTMISTAEGSLP
jgi:peptidoglycan-N-acetylglucosamine deacetylase